MNAAVIEQDTCDVCGHPVDEFEDHGFGRLMVGTCDDCSACLDEQDRQSPLDARRGAEPGGMAGRVMNTATRDALDAIPIPFEDGYAVRAPIPVEDGYAVRAMAIQRSGAWRTAWGMDGCRRPEPFGPVYASARDAATAARHLNERGGA